MYDLKNPKIKNYIIFLLLTIIMVFGSFLYKEKIQIKYKRYREFPIIETKGKKKAFLHLYIFFSKKNCVSCLEYIADLNHLPEEFVVYGVVPDIELKDEMALRALTGASFPLLSNSRFKNFIPLFSPTTLGVSCEGEIYFILPGVPGEKEYLEKFLINFYLKMQQMGY